MISAEALKPDSILRRIDPLELPEEELRWCSVTLNEVLERGSRLEASVFDIEGRHAREVLEHCLWKSIPFCGEGGMAERAFYPGRFKRGYCSSDTPSAVGFLGSSEMLDTRPVPVKFIESSAKNAKEISVEESWVLLSRSGTIGNITFVSATLKEYMVSEHAIRIVSKYPGYVYAFLRSAIGQALVKSSIYGAVVNQVEPEHLESVPIPNPPAILKKRIHDLVINSYALRDESNALLDEAERLLYETLKLPPLSKLHPRYFDNSADLRNYAVKLTDLSGRFDASYHVPIVDSIIRRLKPEAEEITTLGDPRISKRIILPGRFARVYVEEGQGIPFFGGKQIYELDPANKKYLSLTKHSKRLKNELLLKENMVAITARGTIGRCVLVPRHWNGWAMSDNIIRIEPAAEDISGFLYVFLSSEYGCELIRRFTYGAVVDALEICHVSQIPFPLLRNSAVQAAINRLALEANAKRTEAYHAEQKAIRIANNEVIHASEK